MSKRKYPMQWLDKIILHYENPTENDGMSGIQTVLLQADNELALIRSSIQDQIFKATASKKSSKRLVRYYYNAITYYMNYLYDKQQRNGLLSQDHENLCNRLIEKLDCLLNFLNSNYDSYIGADQKVPKIYINRSKRTISEILVRLRKRERQIKDHHSKNVCAIVLNALERFTKSTKHHRPVTFNCLKYRFELLRKLESLKSWESSELCNEFPLDTLLITLNFNSKTYMDYLIECLSTKIIESADPFASLLKFYKQFRQLHTVQELSYNPKYASVTAVMNNWFMNEIEFQRAVLPGSDRKKASAGPNPPKAPVSDKVKVLCNLSSDQIALFLRAADEMRVLSARSMTEVFRSIVPHLATPKREFLSYEGVRIKSYSPEDVDKETIVATLEKMIQKIRDY